MIRMDLRSFVPAPHERLLLRAALLDGADASDAWRRWCDTRTLDGVEQAEYRLLPLVARRAHLVRAEDPLAMRLRGIHRRAWLESQLRRKRAAPLLRDLDRLGIPVLAIKGAALALQCYDDPGCRPISDLDLLVPEARFPEAHRALASAGLRPWLAARPEALRRRTHGVGFTHPDDPLLAIDLHARPLDVLTPRGFDRRLFERAEAIDLGGAPARAPDPGDHLLLVAAHGLRPCSVGPARWVADLTLLVRRRGASIDWDRLLHEARRCRLEWTLGTALRLAHEAFGAAVPAPVLARCPAAPPSWTERLERPRRLRVHDPAADAASLVSPWMRLGVRGRDGFRFAPGVAVESVARAGWFAWKHLWLLPRRNRRAPTMRHAPPTDDRPIAPSAAHAHANAE